MLIGLLAGLMTGALWGLTFIAPRAILPFSAFDLSVLRYLIFGLVSVALMVIPRFRPTGLSPRMLGTGLLLGAFGTFGYFLSISYAVLLAGPVLPPLIAGTAPVLLAIVANFHERSLPWRRLAWPLALIVAGLGVVNVASLQEAHANEASAVLAGVGLSVVALLFWVAYGLVNAMVMRGADAPDALRWTGIQGLGCGVLALLLLPLLSGAPALVDFNSAATQRFFIWVVALGVVVSWLGTFGWVVASERLPMALSAQLIVAETVFGLVYGLAFERRLPTAPEAVGTALQLVGVVVAVAIFSRRRIMPEPGTP
ncbi:drug/metabolite transporter (DMT)-like permease [Angulomicrobium tetraedrale]|uniref:Drug/metabolite transporter (DMT)-like permease n=1 Tax=Ancylobacter tetraedralis TaxID=217068 RepID=A0A839Z7Z4_9HYPH|nr:DMT family transporter [Ancylobacter tetraedralis]MBB3770255.1 drug/metabolite transporter (DMT)-like permease [Ancylobacter tetraedralis]